MFLEGKWFLKGMFLGFISVCNYGKCEKNNEACDLEKSYSQVNSDLKKTDQCRFGYFCLVNVIMMILVILFL